MLKIFFLVFSSVCNYFVIQAEAQLVPTVVGVNDAHFAKQQ